MKKLPTITLKYGDEVIGKLDGYTMAMDESLMRECNRSNFNKS